MLRLPAKQALNRAHLPNITAMSRPLAMAGFASRWKEAVIIVVSLSLVVGLMALGVWQIQRRSWKLDLIDRVTARLQHPPVVLQPSTRWHLLKPSDYEYMHVTVQGRWLGAQTVLTQATTALGQGFWVVSPLELPDASTLLVNRGFIPSALRTQWENGGPGPTAGETITVTGLLRASEPKGGFLRTNDPGAGRWFSRDVQAIAQHLRLQNPAPFFMDAGLPDPSLSANLEARPTTAGPWPKEGLTVVRFSNSHLVYALTWFGLAAMVLVAGAYVLRYERQRSRRGDNQPHGNPL
jgi:surfeit locus 1 family protein